MGKQFHVKLWNGFILAIRYLVFPQIFVKIEIKCTRMIFKWKFMMTAPWVPCKRRRCGECLIPPFSKCSFIENDVDVLFDSSRLGWTLNLWPYSANSLQYEDSWHICATMVVWSRPRHIFAIFQVINYVGTKWIFVDTASSITSSRRMESWTTSPTMIQLVDTNPSYLKAASYKQHQHQFRSKCDAWVH